MSDLPPGGSAEAEPHASGTPSAAAPSAMEAAAPEVMPGAPADELGWLPADGLDGTPGRSAAPGARRRPRRRSGSRWRAAFFVLAGVAIVIGVGWALLGNRVFVVRSVTVTGTHLVTPEQVIAAADVPIGTPLLRVDAGSVTGRVERIRQVASVTVRKDWPDRLVIAVSERVPVMAVRMAGGGYDLLDTRGIVRWDSRRPAGLALLATTLTGTALDGDPGVAAAAGVLTELRPWLARQVSQVRAVPVGVGTEQVTLDLRNGKTVLWGGTERAAQKNRELAILLTRRVRYVDVSAPGTVATR